VNKKNKLTEIRNKLKTGDVSIGSWMQIPSPSIAEILGNAGYDWIAIDMEHGSISVSDLPDIFRSIELGNTLPLVRIAQSSLKDAKIALDAGAGGIIIPMIQSSEQLRKIIDFSCWPPNGTRGVGFSRANLFGKNFDPFDIIFNKPLIIAQIENLQAVNDIDKILKVPGLDAIIIGPYDLSASIGVTGDFENSKFKEALKKILTSCKKNNIPSGIHVVMPDKDELKDKIKEGYQFLAFSIDGLMFSQISLKPKI
jgi:2-dehydro-3-deoxyglucarate aldolase